MNVHFSKCKKALVLGMVLISTLVFALQADACKFKRHLYRWAYAPLAYCSTYNTNTPLEPYMCCKLVYKVSYKKDGVWHHYWKHAWSNKWVSSSCKMADYRATPSFGCSTQSDVYGTDHPINASCQFSYVKPNK